jgi:hypothetical protein
VTRLAAHVGDERSTARARCGEPKVGGEERVVEDLLPRLAPAPLELVGRDRRPSVLVLRAPARLVTRGAEEQRGRALRFGRVERHLHEPGQVLLEDDRVRGRAEPERDSEDARGEQRAVEQEGEHQRPAFWSAVMSWTAWA